jgi:hypothetical protein
MLKTILKIVGVVLLVVLLSAFAIPYFFQDQIKAKIAKAINENVDAKVAFEDADLSLFRSFPQANVSINKLSIVGKAPFAGDTLASFETLDLKMSIKELFKGKDETMSIEGISSSNGLLNIIMNKDGVANYDIALKDQKDKTTGESKPLALNIKEYSLQNFKFKYTDEETKLFMVLDSIDHSGKGDFAYNILDLETKTTSTMSLTMDKVNYMNNIKISLDAVLGIDIKNTKYTFKKNTAKINELPLEFDGFIQLIEAGQQYDLTFKTPTSSFKNFLGLIPSKYSKQLDDVKTTGDFIVSGFAKGLYSDNTVPRFNVDIASNNASFQYPDLPKSVRNIVIKTKIINETGILNDTYVNIDKLTFAIDKDVFNAKGNIKNLVQNALVDAELKGTINLANLSQAYPIKLAKPLSGILVADVTTNFDMQSVENSKYENIKNAGTMRLSDFKYTDENGKPLTISTALVAFNPSRVNLQEFKANTGRTDLSVTGNLDNFYGFLFRNQELKGNFDLKSNQIAVDDFITKTETTTAENKKSAEAIKIPAFLNCTLTATANTVLYDNLTLKNVSGKLSIRDQKVTLENVKSNIFGGLIGLNGSVSTKGKVPIFNMDLNLSEVNIADTFTQLDMMKKIAPIAGIINGKLNSTIQLNGNLDAKEMTPILSTLTGDLLGQLLSTTINASNSTLLNALDSKLGFIDLKNINLNNLKTAITFDNGKVNIKPFDINYKDIKAKIGGSHGFDQSMNYGITFDIPAKYLGSDINNLIAKLTPAEAKKLDNIPVNAILQGSFSQPKITTDLKQATTTLVTNLVNQQKQQLINKGTTALGNLINNNKAPGDTTKAVIPTTKEEIKTEAQTQIKKKTTEILNGFFNKKKKDTVK